MPDRPSLVIVGAGGLGREVTALVEAINAQTPTWALRGFVDDDETLHGTSVLDYPVHGDVSWLAEQADCAYVVAIGDGALRDDVTDRLAGAEAAPTALAHPSVSVHRSTAVGAGALLCAGAAPTVDVDIGAHVVVDQGCTIGHDARLAPFVTLHPGANVSGAVTLERGATVGAGAVILPEVTVGPRATVGAGAVVTEDLPADCTAVGVPARPVS